MRSSALLLAVFLIGSLQAALAQEPKIGFVGRLTHNPEFTALVDGCKHTRIVDCLAIDANSPAEQMSAAQRLIEHDQVDGLVIQSFGASSTPALRDAYERSIPVVVWEYQGVSTLFSKAPAIDGLWLPASGDSLENVGKNLSETLADIATGKEIPVPVTQQCAAGTCPCPGGGCSKHCCSGSSVLE